MTINLPRCCKVVCSLVLTAAVLTCSASAFAKEKEKKEKELPPSGSLSTSTQTGGVSNEVPGLWGGLDPTGEEQAPISGSVSRLNRDEWQMKVFNNSEDIYSVDVEVVQLNDRKSRVKVDSYSYRLKPGESRDRVISSGVGAREAELNLRRFRKIETKKKSEEDAATAESTPGAK